MKAERAAGERRARGACETWRSSRCRWWRCATAATWAAWSTATISADSTLIVYDRYPGGLGYSEKGFARIDELLRICREMVAECPCERRLPELRGPAQPAAGDPQRSGPDPRLSDAEQAGDAAAVGAFTRTCAERVGRSWKLIQKALFASIRDPFAANRHHAERRSITATGRIESRATAGCGAWRARTGRCSCDGWQRVCAGIVCQPDLVAHFLAHCSGSCARAIEPPLSAHIYTVTRHCDRRSLPPIDPLEAENPSGKHLVYQRRVSHYVELTPPGAPCDGEPNVKRNKRAGPNSLAFAKHFRKVPCFWIWKPAAWARQ